MKDSSHEPQEQAPPAFALAYAQCGARNNLEDLTCTLAPKHPTTAEQGDLGTRAHYDGERERFFRA